MGKCFIFLCGFDVVQLPRCVQQLAGALKSKSPGPVTPAVALQGSRAGIAGLPLALRVASVMVVHDAASVELMDFAHPLRGASAQVCLQQTGIHADLQDTGHLVKSIAGGISFLNDLS